MRRGQSRIRALTLFFVIILVMGGLTGCGRSRETANIRIGSLKGPTSMGILFLMDKAEKGETEDAYEF